MKIGFIGNMGNSPFMIAKSLKDKGYDIKFIVIGPKSYKQGRPEFRNKKISYPYPDWIYDMPLTPVYKSIFSFQSYVTEIRTILFDCDIVVYNDATIRMLPLMNFKHKSLILGTGVEIEYGIDYKKWFLSLFSNYKHIIKIPFYMYHIYLFRKALKMSDFIYYAHIDLIPFVKNEFKKMSLEEKLLKINSSVVDSNNLGYHNFIKKNKVKIFYTCRFRFPTDNGSTNPDARTKGSDIFLEGLYEYSKRNNMENLEIYLVEYGEYEIAKKIINKYGLSNNIRWLTKLSQKEVYDEVISADIVIGNLGKDLMGQAELDSMSLGRPVISNKNYTIGSEKLPNCQASNAKEVYEWLITLVNDKVLRETIGKKSSDYINKNCTADIFANNLLNKVLNIGINK